MTPPGGNPAGSAQQSREGDNNSGWLPASIVRSATAFEGLLLVRICFLGFPQLCFERVEVEIQRLIAVLDLVHAPPDAHRRADFFALKVSEGRVTSQIASHGVWVSSEAARSTAAFRAGGIGFVSTETETAGGAARKKLSSRIRESCASRCRARKVAGAPSAPAMAR